MRRTRIRASVLVASAFSFPLLATPQVKEVIVADEYRTAFYEQAPHQLAASMRAAVAKACGSSSASGRTGATSWLCKSSSALYFYRSVRVNGYEDYSGYVCETDQLGSSLKYLTPDMIEEEPDCVVVSYDYEETEHRIGVE